MEHKIDQLSDEWFKVRIGKITGSRFPLLMQADNARKPWTDTQLSILTEVASQILTGLSEDTFTSKAMEWGTDHEVDAIQALSDYLMKPIRTCGFYEYSEFVGASPDGIIGNDEMTAEVKCPLSKTHMTYLMDSNELWKKYRWQVVAETLCTGIDKGIIASYDPRFPVEKQLVVHDPGDLSADREKMIARIDEAVIIIKDMIK